MKDDEKARSKQSQGRKKSPSRSSSIKRPAETCWIDDTAKPRQPEQALAWQEAIFEGSRDAIFITDVDSKIVAVNEAACVLTGHSKEKLLTMRIPDLHEEADLHAYQTYHDRIMAGEETLSEAKIFRKDGSKVDTEFNNRRIVLDGLLYMHTTARDITERKQVQERLHESEERYRDLVENSHELIYTHDLHGQILSVNHTAALRLGHNPTALVGRNLDELLAPEEKSGFEEYLGRIRRKGSAAGAWVLQSATGERRNWEYHSTLRSDAKQGPYVRGMAHDVTERVRAEEALRDSEETARALLNATSDVAFLLDASGKTLAINDIAASSLGSTTTELLGKNLYEHIPGELAQARREHINRAIETKEIIEFEDQRRGTWFLNRVYPLPDIGNQPKRVAIYAQNVTERKRASLRQETLYQVLHSVSEQLNLNLLAQSAIKTIAHWTTYPHVCLALPEENGTRWVVRGAAGSLAAGIGANHPIHQGVIGRAFKTRENQWVRDILEDASYMRDVGRAGAPGLRSEFVALLWRADQVIGALNIESERVDAFDEKDVEMFQSLADMLALAVEKARLYQEAQEEITERRQAEKLLQQAKDFAENLIRTANVIIVSMDLTGKILIFNETAEKITGFSRADMVGKNWFEVLVPKDRYPQVWEEFQQGGGGWPRVYENPILTRAGEARIISWQNNEVQEAGKIVGSISFGIDITEHKRAEEALQESEQRYRLLYENSLDSVLLTAPDGSVLSANPAACQMFGRTEAEIRQLGRNGLIDKSDPRLPVALEERTRTGSFKGELTGLRSDGTKFPFELTSSIFTNRKGQPRSSMIIRDISERKRADELLRQSEERYKLMFEQAPLAINITRGTEILYCNPTYISMFGFSSLNEIQRIPPLELFTAEWRPFIQENIRRRSQGLTSPNGYEAECIRKDGTRFPVQMNFVRTIFYDGLATVGFILDITERKRAEAALAASREQLRALSQYLQAAREEERTYIAREIHDELGQSLTALKMDLAWLSRQLPPEQSSLVEKTAGMSDMVDGTIQMVRRVASQLRPGMLDDLGLVAALEWQAGEFQSRTGIACHLDLPENVTVLNQDQATTMFRIFQETLTNISRHAQATKVRIAIKELLGHIELIVRDNGIGITQDQLNDPRSLGLTGMRERVQTFGGSLKIKSTPGKGTSVHVRMPLVNMSSEREA